MSVEYFLHSTNPDAAGSGGYFAVYSNGLVRRIASEERNHIKELHSGLKTVDIPDKDPGTRLQEMDYAVRGMMETRK